MKAIQVAQYGQAEALQLKDVPDLKPNEDQVLINVAGSGINPGSPGRKILKVVPPPTLLVTSIQPLCCLTMP